MRAWFDDIQEGDVNLDGVVDIADVLVVGANWQQSAGLLGGDANGDGIVDIADVLTVGANWQSTGGAPGGGGGGNVAPVPEPATLALAAIGIALIAGARWRRVRRTHCRSK